jgi:hypothetical protein
MMHAAVVRSRDASPVKTRNGTTTGVAWNREMPPEPREILEVVMSIPSADLEPGPYRFEVRMNTVIHWRGAPGAVGLRTRRLQRSSTYEDNGLAKSCT